MDIETFEINVVRWAEERGIFTHSNSVAQCNKTIEEVEELHEAIESDDLEGITDAIGDIMVTLVILASMKGKTLEECYTHAWNEIKDRKGKMENGLFVKEA